MTGLIYDPTGDRLSPTQCNKRSKIYHYYTSSRLIRREDKSVDGWRLPANHFEDVIVSGLVSFFRDQKSVVEKLTDRHRNPQSGSTEIQHLLTQASAFAHRLQASKFVERRDILQEIVHRIELATGEMTLSLKIKSVMAQLGCGKINDTQDVSDDNTIAYNTDAHIAVVHDTCVYDTGVQLTIPVKLKRRGVETKLVLGGDTPDHNPDQKMIKIIAHAHIWFQQVSTGVVTSVHQIAEREKCDASEVSRVMPLALLAPDIVTAILAGRQPIDLTADRLKRLSGRLLNCWKQQKTLLGFAD